MTKLTRLAVEGLDLSQKEKDRCRNFFAMGLVFWLYDRPLEPTLRYIEDKFGKKPEIAQANTAALKAGYHYGETVEAINTQFHVPKAKLTPGKYTSIVGNTALAYGLMAAARLSDKRLFLGAYPITPASSILEELARHKNFDVLTFQAEDEIAAMTATIGAAFAGAMAVTASSGPGIALKGEGIGLAIMTELPMIVINVQRGGPSTGLPTKTEQADLFQAIFGRNGECPMPVIAACSPADCFDVAQEAWRIAVRYMVPVMLLTDGYIANGSEPWRIPKYADLPKIEITHPGPPSNGDHFLPYQRDERLARPWALPGTPGLGAPHRRSRKAGHHRQRQLRPGQPSAHDQHSGRESRQHRQRSPTAKDRRPRQRRPARRSAGAAPTAPVPRPSTTCKPRAKPSRIATCATSTRCRRTWATS